LAIKRKILVATTNPGKAVELQAMLDADVNWLSLADFPGIPEVEMPPKKPSATPKRPASGQSPTIQAW
jgi:inosine/xanthosine triphosphate pyrophosphatase family protein